jgi:hypothetical protein
MISERQFSTTFTSFWTESTPLGETMVRTMNLGAERFLDPMQTKMSNRINGFINELGFRTTESAFTLGMKTANKPLVERLYTETENYIRRFPRPEIPNSETERETAIDDAFYLGNRLLSLVLREKGDRDICFRPRFKGCGIHDECEGDILIGNEIWEVKSGERKFRQPDIRQLLIYCALNHASKTNEIILYRFVNPRAGLMFNGTLRGLTETIAGCEPETLFDEIIEFLSARQTSV